MTEQLSLGLERKQLGQHAVRENNEEWIALGLAFVEALHSGCSVDAELIREWIGNPPGHANAMGALLSVLQKANLIRRVGYRTATRASRHAAEIKTFERT